MLLGEQFSEEGLATVQLKFRGKNIQILFENTERLDYGEYHIRGVQAGENTQYLQEEDIVRIPAEQILKMSECGVHRIVITLGK